MDVILLERIEKLGSIGDVVKVKNGYARISLLPRGNGARATIRTARSSRPIARRSRRRTPSARAAEWIRRRSTAPRSS